MNSPKQNLLSALADGNARIAAKGGEGDATTIKGVMENIDTIPSGGGGGEGGYVRPSDRLAKPILNDNEVWWLFGVQELSPNDMAFQAVVSSGTYRVDWGDGTNEDVTSNTICEHQYDWDTLDVQVDSQGYKEVWIKLTPTLDSANITQVLLDVAPSWRPTPSATAVYQPQVLELYVRASQMSVLRFTTTINAMVCYAIMEIFGLWENSLTATGASYLCSRCYSLQHLDSLDLTSVTSGDLTAFFNDAIKFNEALPTEAINGLNRCTAAFMYNCYAYNQKFPEGVSFANCTTNFMYDCFAYNQPFPEGVSFANCNRSFMYKCYAYNQKFPEGVSFVNCTTYFMYNCHSFSHTITITRAVTTAFGTNSFAQMWNCKGLRILNWQSVANNSVSIAGMQLDRDALVAFFGDLPLAISGGTNNITVTNCYGASSLTAADRAMCTNKGYTLIG